MRFLKWNKSNEVFVPEIDTEHQEIFDAASELRQALTAAAPLPQIHEVLHRLIASVEDHFSHEERLMRKSHYDALNWHKQQHKAALKRMRDLIPRVEQGDVEAGTALIEFLLPWFRDHVGLSDRMMGAFLRNQQRDAAQ